MFNRLVKALPSAKRLLLLMTDFNYISVTPPPPTVPDFLLLEDGNFLLLETGGKIEFE